MGLNLAKWCVENLDAIGLAGKKVRVLWVAHREVLLNQVMVENKELEINCPNLTPVSMFHTDPHSLKVGWDAVIVVFDETHRIACSTAATMVNVLDPAVTIGLTATPLRTDKHELCFGKTIKEASYFALVRDGWLSQYEYYSISGGWTPSSVAASYLKDRDRWGKSLMFFLSRKECRDCCDILQAEGVNVDVIDGTMTDRQRTDILERFEDGSIDVLINAMLLTEGFNVPDIKTVFVRDSSNKGPTTQMGGRGLRIHEATGIKRIVQSVSTKYPFTKVAPPKHQFMEEGGAWLDVGESEEAHKQAIAISKKLAHAKVSIPKYIQFGGSKYVALADRSEKEQEKNADKIEGGLL
jgi:superfamily II DNA or RNA helicase